MCSLRYGKYLLSSTDIDKGPLCGCRIKPMACSQLCVHGLPQLLHKHIMDPTLHQEAVGAYAGL